MRIKEVTKPMVNISKTELLASFIKQNWLVLGGASFFVSVTSIILFLSLRSSKRKHSKKRGKERIKIIRYPGIINRGNTCYLGCVLQALASVRLECVGYDDFTLTLLHMLYSLNNPDCPTLELDELEESLGARFNNEQQDAHEILLLILGRLEKCFAPLPDGLGFLAHSKSNESDKNLEPASFNEGIFQPILSSSRSLHSHHSIPIHKSSSSYPSRHSIYGDCPWEGQYINQIKCTECNHSPSSPSITNFSVLTLTPPQGIDCDISALISSNMLPDALSDYQCTNCQKINVVQKSMTICKWPSILIMHIQLIDSVTRKSSFRSRVTLKITKGNFIYDLYAIIIHNGNVNRGHYTCCRRIDGALGGSTWIYCDDSSVERISVESILNITNPYMLLYKKIN